MADRKPIKRRTRSKVKTVHGHVVGKRTPEYMSWENMKARCLNPKNRAYPRYGGRGITVCERWLKFENFIADMGLKPTPKHTIERRDNASGYAPSNCYWATQAEQSRNRRSTRLLTHDGKTMCIADWAAATGLSQGRISDRLKAGWSVERALGHRMLK